MVSPLVTGESIVLSQKKGLAAGHASISVLTSLEALCEIRGRNIVVSDVRVHKKLEGGVDVLFDG